MGSAPRIGPLSGEPLEEQMVGRAAAVMGGQVVREGVEIALLDDDAVEAVRDAQGNPPRVVRVGLVDCIERRAQAVRAEQPVVFEEHHVARARRHAEEGAEGAHEVARLLLHSGLDWNAASRGTPAADRSPPLQEARTPRVARRGVVEDTVLLRRLVVVHDDDVRPSAKRVGGLLGHLLKDGVQGAQEVVGTVAPRNAH